MESLGRRAHRSFPALISPPAVVSLRISTPIHGGDAPPVLHSQDLVVLSQRNVPDTEFDIVYAASGDRSLYARDLRE